MSKKKKLYFSFHSQLSFSLCIFSNPLYFSLLFCLLSLTQFFKTAPVLSLTCRDFSFFRGLHIFTPGTSLLQPIFTGQMASLFISSSFPSFLTFTLFTSSHNKCEPIYLDFANQFLFFSSPLAEWPLPFVSFFSFFLPSNVSHKFNIMSSFMWLDFCTSLHKCCCT